MTDTNDNPPSQPVHIDEQAVHQFKSFVEAALVNLQGEQRMIRIEAFGDALESMLSDVQAKTLATHDPVYPDAPSPYSKSFQAESA